MYSVSDRFIREIKDGAIWIVRADVYRGRELLYENLPLEGGEMIVDRTAAVRRRASLNITVTDPDLVPFCRWCLLFPSGNEIHLRAGLQLSDGTEETVPLGVFRISRPQVNDSDAELSLSVDAYDRSRSVSRARLTDVYQIPSGTNYGEAIRGLIKHSIPTLGDDDFRFMTVFDTTPTLVFDIGEDPWKLASEMAGSVGGELFFDGEGRCVLRPEPDPSNDPVTVVYEEGEDSVMTSIQKDLDDERAYNGVIVIGQNSEMEAPVRGESWDRDPESNTYYDPDFPDTSVYGPVPYFIESQYVTSEDQAIQSARANLRKVVGVMEQVSFNAIQNPAHEAGDIIQIKRERSRVDVVNVIDSISMDLSVEGEMTVVTRKRRVEQ